MIKYDMNYENEASLMLTWLWNGLFRDRALLALLAPTWALYGIMLYIIETYTIGNKIMAFINNRWTFWFWMLMYLDHKKDPEPAEDDEDAKDEGESEYGDQVEEGGEVQTQVASQQNVGDQAGTLNRFWSF